MRNGEKEGRLDGGVGSYTAAAERSRAAELCVVTVGCVECDAAAARTHRCKSESVRQCRGCDACGMYRSCIELG